MRTTVLALLAALTLGLVLPSCSSTDPDGSGTVQMNSTLDNASVSRTDGKSTDRVEGFSTFVNIERVRILISRLKFKSVSEDTSGGKDIKTGPAVVTFENGEVNVVFKEPVPNGTYDRVKLEKHKFSSSEADQYKDDPVFGEFAVPDRLTIIIEGSYTEGTDEQPFVIQDDATENLWIDFPENLVVNDDTNAEIELQFDAEQVFKLNGVVLNPFDDKDRKEVFKNLKKAFRLQND